MVVMNSFEEEKVEGRQFANVSCITHTQREYFCTYLTWLSEIITQNCKIIIIFSHV